MTGAGEVEIKERISLTRQAYSVLNEKIKYDECSRSSRHTVASVR
jgi:hypothetical protein